MVEQAPIVDKSLTPKGTSTVPLEKSPMAKAPLVPKGSENLVDMDDMETEDFSEKDFPEDPTSEVKEYTLSDEEQKAIEEEEVPAILQDLSVEEQDMVGQYFIDAGTHKLLTREEETSYFQRIELGRESRNDLFDFQGTKEAKKALVHCIEDGVQAESYVETHNLKLVVSIAKRHRGRGLPFLDLIQEGNIGLLRAMKRFDYRLGNKFSTYATWWINQSIGRACFDFGHTIRFPVHVGERMYRWSQLEEQGYTDEEMAKKLKLKPKQYGILQDVKRQQQLLSLDSPSPKAESQDDGALEDAIPDVIDTESLSDRHELGIVLRKFLKERLNAEQYRYMVMKYGLTNDNAIDEHIVAKPLSTAELMAEFGMSESQIRSTENGSLEKLRTYFRTHPNVKNMLLSFIRPVDENRK